MTRTERNQYPAALLKDRRSRSGLTNQSETARKHGAGAHNWGSYQQEGEHEAAANLDATKESQDYLLDNLDDDDEAQDDGNDEDGIVTPLKGREDVIATSPTDSMSSFDSHNGGANGTPGKVPGLGGRRMSNVSDEERERARIYREGVLGKGPVDLAHIAKTSYGIAQSPPNASFLATSPTATKNAFAMKQ